MKKLICLLLCAVCSVTAAALSACGGRDENEYSEINVYMPDGAPALSLAGLMDDENAFGEKVNYKVVGANEIESAVTYKDDSKNADICILPVNSASKLLGSGEKYLLLGSVTHGNLFLVSAKDKPDVGKENAVSVLADKKVGVINLAAFPGAVTNLILIKYGLYGSVALESVNATQVSGTETAYDYFVMPEPAASAKTGNANLNLKIAGSLQELYGENGYPQAVMVAKKELIEKKPAFIEEFMQKASASTAWLTADGVSGQDIISVISAHYADPENTTPQFNAKNLTPSVIENCAVGFVYGEKCKTEVKAFLDELIAAGDKKAVKPEEAFYYIKK